MLTPAAEGYGYIDAGMTHVYLVVEPGRETCTTQPVGPQPANRKVLGEDALLMGNDRTVLVSEEVSLSNMTLTCGLFVRVLEKLFTITRCSEPCYRLATNSRISSSSTSVS